MRKDVHPTWGEFKETTEFNKMESILLCDRNGVPLTWDMARSDSRVVLCTPLGGMRYEVVLD
jgi:hypothetical protein